MRDLNALIQNRSRVWLILSHSRDRQHLSRRELESHYGVKIEEKFDGVKIYLYYQPG